VLHIIELYKEGQPLVLVQIAESCLPRHGEAPSKGIDARREERNLVPAHTHYVLKIRCKGNKKKGIKNEELGIILCLCTKTKCSLSHFPHLNFIFLCAHVRIIG
jgi:hypothetical protein